MALPIIPLLLFGTFIVLFAWQRDVVIKLLWEAAMDVVFGILFTMGLNLIIPLTQFWVLVCVFLIAFFFFCAALLNKKGTGGVEALLQAQR